LRYQNNALNYQIIAITIDHFVILQSSILVFAFIIFLSKALNTPLIFY